LIKAPQHPSPQIKKQRGCLAATSLSEEGLLLFEEAEHFGVLPLFLPKTTFQEKSFGAFSFFILKAPFLLPS
jgi:hypothetical protein